MTLSHLRLKHPLFSKLTMLGFKFIMDNCLLYKLKPGQYIYRENLPVGPNIYFIMYGQLICHSVDGGYFGSIMCVGHTLGEEVLLGPAGSNRSESV
jgi:hypothetical protein